MKDTFDHREAIVERNEKDTYLCYIATRARDAIDRITPESTVRDGTYCLEAVEVCIEALEKIEGFATDAMNVGDVQESPA